MDHGLAAVFFDLDGLLVDSEPLWTLAEVELARRLGGTWSWDLKRAIVGTRLDAAVPSILAWYGVEAGAAAVALTTRWLLARMVELFGTRLGMRPGARALLDELARAQVPLALVSSSYRVLVDAALRTLGTEVFATTMAGDEVRHGKPDPEPYLTAAARLGVDAASCVVVEDSAAGVAAGEAAGCIVVAVPDVAPIPPAPGRTIVASLAELNLDALAALVASRAGQAAP